MSQISRNSPNKVKMIAMMMGKIWANLGSTVAGLMFISAMFRQYFPNWLRSYFERSVHKLIGFLNPYIQITFREYGGDRFRRSELFKSIETYLSVNSSKRAKRLKADLVKNSKSLILSMDDHEEITEEFQGTKLWWASRKMTPKSTSLSVYPASDEVRYYKLTFHKRDRELITRSYLNHVMEEGKAIGVRNRQKKLYTNSTNQNWSHVVFEHPATFKTLAMDPIRKQEIIDDLVTFSKGKEYYAKIGKAWKRGYLLYGPPGTGKSTMIAAMANLLDYDIYDLELTAVKENTELRRLLIETSGKSIIVIEDIDCSIDLTGQRKKKKKKDEEDKDATEKKDPVQKKAKKEEKINKESKVTLSGLLNFIDGLWSACGGERLIVFTTNYLDKLDPALIRRGRMDKHIKMSYCSFEAFKVLSKNYLDLESHDLFGKIRSLMEETTMTPADVAENLMPKTIPGDAKSCLENLIDALEKAKEEARMKAQEEAKTKAEAEEESLDKEVVAETEQKDDKFSPQEDNKTSG